MSHIVGGTVVQPDPLTPKTVLLPIWDSDVLPMPSKALRQTIILLSTYRDITQKISKL